MQRVGVDAQQDDRRGHRRQLPRRGRRDQGSQPGRRIQPCESPARPPGPRCPAPAPGHPAAVAAAAPRSVDSSSRARGFPPVARYSRSSRADPAGAGGHGRRAARPPPAGPAPRPRSAVSPASVNAHGSPARTPTSSSTGSANNRRAANTSASADGRSSSWPSSTSNASGRRCAARQIRLRVPAPTANRSPVTGGRSAKAADRASACGPGQFVDQLQHRAQQLQQPGERDLLLGLHPGRPQHLHPARWRCRPVQQRGLADAGLAGQQQHAALADPGARHRGVMSARSDSRPISMCGA